MVDHKRLDALTELVERSGAKLIAVGDGKQLPSIGPGGMFDRLTGHAPTVELETIHRTTDPQEQRAWQALRAGEPERAMAHYKAQRRLHLADTRDQAAESAVQAWAQLTEEAGIDKVALIADASNKEIDRLNARAQHLRAQRGELGPRTPARHSPLWARRRRSRRVHRSTPPARPTARRERNTWPRHEHRPGRNAHAPTRRIRPPATARTPGGRVAAARLRPTRLPPTGRDRRSCRRAYRRMANKPRDRLRSSHPRPQRHRLVHSPRPAWRRRSRPRANHTTRRTDDPKSSAHSIRHPPRNPRPVVGPQPRSATSQPPDSSRGQAHANTSTRRARSRHRTRTLTDRVALTVRELPDVVQSASVTPGSPHARNALSASVWRQYVTRGRTSAWRTVADGRAPIGVMRERVSYGGGGDRGIQRPGRCHGRS
jgi:hypothetical protein